MKKGFGIKLMSKKHKNNTNNKNRGRNTKKIK